MGKAITHNEYKKMLFKHNSKLTLISTFKGLSRKVIVIDHLLIRYNVNSRSLLQNKHPHISVAVDKTDAFNKKLHVIFPKLTLITSYIKGNSKGVVVDENGIEYIVKPESLLQKQYPSMRSAKDKNKGFSINANLIHHLKYDYSKVAYINDKVEVEIICPYHGSFRQRPNNHINQKQGCPECNKVRGWSKKEWIKYAQNKTCRFYIIECFNENEQFIKVGITTTSIKQRFQSKREMPYSYNVLLDIKDTAEMCWSKEQACLKEYKAVKHKPSIKFKGHTECLSINIKNELL